MTDQPQRWQWTVDRKPSNAVERRHKRADDLGRAVVRGWIRHPAVAREVEAARPAMCALAAPLGLPDQRVTTLVTARFLNTGGFFPDGTEEPDVFAVAPVELLEDALRVQPLFVQALQELANRIASAGAPLDPADQGVLLVLAQLTLLKADLTLPAAELVDQLNVLPPGWVETEAARQGHVATHSSRHGRSARFQADLAACGEFLARRLGPSPIRPPYSGGRKRTTRSDTLQLQRALALLAAQDPSLTASSLLGAVGDGEHPALPQLRIALGAEEDWLPDQRRIERNWPKTRQRRR